MNDGTPYLPGMNPPLISPMSWGPEQEHLIQVLDKEIELIQIAEQRPGWTLWAILAALGAVLWLLLDQLDSPYLTVENIPILFLSFSMFLESLGLMYHSVSYGQTKSSKRLRFIWSSKYSEDRPYLLFEIARYTLIVYLALTLPNNVGWLAFFIVVFFFGLIILVLLFAVVFSFLNLPLPSNQYSSGWKAGIKRLVFFILAVLVFWSAKKYLLAVSTLNTIGVIDFRVTALIVATIFLIEKLLKGVKESPLLESLIDIRRDLVWGNMNLVTAISRADIAMAGLKVSDVFQEDLRKVLDLFEQNDQEVKSIIGKYESIETTLPKNDSDFTKEQSDKVLKLFDSLDEHFEKSSKIKSKLMRRLVWFNARADMVRRYSPEAADEINAVTSKIESASKTTDKTSEDLVTVSTQVRGRLKAVWDASKHEREGLQKKLSEIESIVDNEDKHTPEEVRRARELLDVLQQDLQEYFRKWPTESESKSDPHIANEESSANK
jgi:hypothetical protein